MLDRIPHYIWKALILVIWGGIILGFGLIRFDSLGIDEGAAMALLLNWSAAEKIATPVTIFGMPDFRALLFVPLGLYWPGSIIAAKVFTLLFAFGAALYLHKMDPKSHGDEAALLSTGLLLISPALLQQLDSISSGIYLLTLFGVAMHLNDKYRASEHVISSLYFLQMLLVAITVTLHPIGLAYPLALAWTWYRKPKHERQMKQIWLGIAAAVLFMLAMQAGWIAIEWQSNPLTSLHDAILGRDKADLINQHWLIGIITIALLVYFLYRDYQKPELELMDYMLVFAVLIGFTAADSNWALVTLTYILFRGIPELIRVNKSLNAAHFMGQRGIVLIALFILSITFMQADKLHALQIGNNILSPRELLITRLAEEAKDRDKPFLAASQWPAQTMIFCKRDVFLLPPAQQSGEQLKDIIKNITHIMFDHMDLKNRELARNIAELGGYTETLEIQPHGVIVKIRGESMQSGKNAENLSSRELIESNQADKNSENVDSEGKNN